MSLTIHCKYKYFDSTVPRAEGRRQKFHFCRLPFAVNVMLNLSYENNSPSTVMNKEFLTQTVRDNTNIIDRDDNWNLLLYKEAYHIKRLTPFLNNGLKASRELRLFS